MHFLKNNFIGPTRPLKEYDFVIAVLDTFYYLGLKIIKSEEAWDSKT